VYYRWHPLNGQTLPVWRRIRNRQGEHVFCRSIACVEDASHTPAVKARGLSLLMPPPLWLRKSMCDDAVDHVAVWRGRGARRCVGLRRFGRGRHKVALNFADSLADVCAATAGDSIVVSDFTHIRAAI